MLSSSQNSAAGISFIVLKDWEKRKESSQSADALSQLFTGMGMGLIPSMPELSNLEGISFAFSLPPIIGMSTTGGFEGYIQNRSGATMQALMDKTEEFLTAANQHPALSNVTTTFTVGTPQYHIDLDREKARALGVAINDVYTVMQSTFGSLYVNDFTYMGRNFRVTVSAEAKFRRSPTDLRYIYVKSNTGN